jgi:hypothetical protein
VENTRVSRLYRIEILGLTSTRATMLPAFPHCAW